MLKITVCPENSQELSDIVKVLHALEKQGVQLHANIISLERLYHDFAYERSLEKAVFSYSILKVQPYFAEAVPFPYLNFVKKSLTVLFAKLQVIRYVNGSDLILSGIQAVFQRMLYTFYGGQVPFVCLHRALLTDTKSKINRRQDFVFRFIGGILQNSPLSYMRPIVPGVGYADYYFVVGEINKDYLVSHGINEQEIFVTGCPTYDDFPVEEGLEHDRVSSSHGKTKIYYITGAYEWVGDKVGEKWQQRKIRSLIVYANEHKGIELTIRVHPREKRRKYDELARVYPHIKIEHYRVEGSLFEDIMKYDIVCGGISQVLYDAVLLGKPVIFYLLGDQVERYGRFFQTIGLEYAQSIEDVGGMINLFSEGDKAIREKLLSRQRSRVRRIIHLPAQKPSQVIAQHILGLLDRKR